MTHLYVKLCDYCGKPVEADSLMHGASFNVGFMRQAKEYSQKILRGEFDLCFECTTNLGLAQIVKKLMDKKKDNENNKLNFKKTVKFITLKDGKVLKDGF